MGNQPSTFPERPPNFSFFSLTFFWDTIRVIDAPNDVVEVIHSTILSTYSSLQRVSISEDGNSAHFKFEGYPFVVNSSKETGILVKRMICALLENLRLHGWELALSSDLCRFHDFSTLFFQKVSNNANQKAQIMCLSLSGYDRLQLINAPKEAHAALAESVGNLLQKQNANDEYFEVQLIGDLTSIFTSIYKYLQLSLNVAGAFWISFNSTEDFFARSLLLNCFSQFQKLRYRFYGTANIKGTADSIFFIQDDEEVVQCRFCVMSLNKNDRIRLIGAPDEVIQVVGKCISEYWCNGIQKAEPKEQGIYYEYKLGGFPWLSYGPEAVGSRYLITMILERMVCNGWGVVTALDISRMPNDKAVFIFRQCAPTTIPHFAICPTDFDKIRIINADREMLQFIDRLIRDSWTPGIQKIGIYGRSFEVKLVGYPWNSFNYGKVFELSRMMMTRILHGLAIRGWKVICSADISTKRIKSQYSKRNSVDMHSWFVAYVGPQPQPQLTVAADSILNNSSQLSVPAPPVPESPATIGAPPSYEEAVKTVKL
uniref:Myotubularin phosphatase domain-containing protein n=1 Tax=Syphacia muris TaxID=451379 RepID=A0A0N5AJN9_9BILA